MPRPGLAAPALAALLSLSAAPGAVAASLSSGGGHHAAVAAAEVEKKRSKSGQASSLGAAAKEEDFHLGGASAREEGEEAPDRKAEDDEGWNVQGRLRQHLDRKLKKKFGNDRKQNSKIRTDWLKSKIGRLAGMGEESWTGKPSFIFMMDTDYPPYAMWSSEVGRPDEAAGFGVDFARAVCDFCDLECDFIVDKWDKCWSNDLPGDGLMNGHFHACMTYTNQYQRQWSLEFSHSILAKNKPGGLLSRLKDDGSPVIDPMKSNLTGLKICDVSGWAPTIKTLSYSKNDNDGGKLFYGYDTVVPETTGPDAAMKLLLNGSCDGVYMYADMIEHKKPEKCDGCSWDPTLYDKLGVSYAWVHTGLNEHMANGTTLTMAKKHSRVADMLNPCIADIIESEKYAHLCEKHDLQAECFETEFMKKKVHEDDGTCNAYQDSNGIRASCACDSGYCGSSGAVVTPEVEQSESESESGENKNKKKKHVVARIIRWIVTDGRFWRFW